MKKIISLPILFSVLLVSLAVVISSPKETNAQNIGSLQSIVTPGFSFKKDLRLGDTDPDVRELQRVLNADIDTMILTDGVGSRGKESTYFGNLTKDAVVKFQNKYKDIVLTLNSITTADGIVNKATRTRLNLLIGEINTYDSVGLPQSRAGTPSTYVAPTVVATQTQTQSQVCQFVDLLINIGAIESSKANIARSAVGCSTITSTSPSSVCQFVELLIDIDVIESSKANQARSALNCSTSGTTPYVNMKVNGENGPISVSLPRNVTLSWTSSGVTSCTSGSMNKPTSGSQTVYLTNPGTYRVTCTGPNGSAYDQVTINDSNNNNNNNNNNSSFTLNASVQVSTTSATFSITSSRTANYRIYYGLNSALSSNVAVPGQSISATYNLTGLSAFTTYFFRVSATDTNGAVVDSNIGTFTTGLDSNINSTSTKSLSILVNNKKSFSTTTSQLSFSFFFPTISWTSTGFSACKITSSPIVSGLYETPVALNGSQTPSLFPASYEGKTTFTLACAAGSAVTTLNQGFVSSLIPSADLSIATATLTIKVSSSTLPLASTTVPEEPGVRVDFSGRVIGVLPCYDTSGGLKERFSQVVIYPCVGSVISRAYEVSATGLETGTRSGSEYGVGSNSPAIFLWDSVDGNPMPQAGQSILGIGAPKEDAFGEKCPKTSLTGTSVGAGVVDGGWLKEYELSNAPCSSGTSGGSSSSGGTSGSTGGLFQTAGSFVGTVAGSSMGIPGAITGNIIGGAVGGVVDSVSSGFGLW